MTPGQPQPQPDLNVELETPQIGDQIGVLLRFSDPKRLLSTQIVLAASAGPSGGARHFTRRRQSGENTREAAVCDCHRMRPGQRLPQSSPEYVLTVKSNSPNCLTKSQRTEDLLSEGCQTRR